MRVHIALMLVFALTSAQEKPKPSMEETLSWVKNFTNVHGSMIVNDELLQTTTILRAERCTIDVEHSFPTATTEKQIKKRTVKLYLAAMDPEDVKTESRTYLGSQVFSVEIVRSDAATKNEADIENGDASKTKSWTVMELFFMDSAENAARLASGLSHAIILCGGEPAPY